MLWTACSSSERSSYLDMSLHAPGSMELRMHINRRSVTLLGSTSVTCHT